MEENFHFANFNSLASGEMKVAGIWQFESGVSFCLNKTLHYFLIFEASILVIENVV